MTKETDTPTHCDECGESFEKFHGTRCERFNIVDGEFELTRTICPSCDYKELILQFVADGRVNTTLSREAALYNYHAHERFSFDGLREDIQENWQATSTQLEAIYKVSELVQAKVREFEIRNWFPTVKRLWDDASGPLSGENEAVNVKVWGSAGRVLITVQKPGTGDGEPHVTMIFDESADYPRAGIQGYYGTQDEALELMEGAINHFPTLQRDDNVHYV